MVTVVFRFPGGRYHATPWGHHVNEGQIEWPPSPWRLVRALLSVGFTALGWRDVPDLGRALLDRLASVLPTYIVPQAAAGHTRHYMPIGGLRTGLVENTTVVFDTWAHVADGELAVTWPVTLTADERGLLDLLVTRLGYLGRSESWVDARLVGDEEPAPNGARVVPSDASPRPGAAWEQVALLAPESPDVYAASRAPSAEAEQPPPAGRGRRGARGGRGPRGAPRPTGTAPADLLGCLRVETTWLRAHGWSQPPGSRRVLYWRPTASLEAGAPLPSRREAEVAPVEVALVALATPTGNAHALPPVTRTLPQAELMHRALVSHAVRLGGHCEALVGKTLAGEVLKGHGHAHVLPLDLDGDGMLDHVLVWAPMQLDGHAQAALRAVRKSYMKGGVGELRVALAGMGARDALCAISSGVGDRLVRIVGAAEGARRWVSATPFVPPRFLKSTGRNTLEGQVQAELASRGLPAATRIEVIDPQTEEGRPFRHFVRRRRNGGAPPSDVGYGLRVELATAARGPICLGYGSHFGLGRFESE